MQEKWDKVFFVLIKRKIWHMCLTSQFNRWEVESAAFPISLAVRCWKENSERHIEKGPVENKQWGILCWHTALKWNLKKNTGKHNCPHKCSLSILTTKKESVSLYSCHLWCPQPHLCFQLERLFTNLQNPFFLAGLHPLKENRRRETLADRIWFGRPFQHKAEIMELGMGQGVGKCGKRNSSKWDNSAPEAPGERRLRNHLVL